MSFPSLELLENTHKFPTDYTFKIIGDASGEFVKRAVAAARVASGASKDPHYTTRESEGGKHISVTVTLRMETAQKVLDMYAALSKIAGVRLLL